MAFHFDLIFGVVFLLFGALMGLGLGFGSKSVFGSTHIVQQLLFSLLLTILTFNFDIILGLFFYFFGFNVGFKKCFRVHSCI